MVHMELLLLWKCSRHRFKFFKSFYLIFKWRLKFYSALRPNLFLALEVGRRKAEAMLIFCRARLSNTKSAKSPHHLSSKASGERTSEPVFVDHLRSPVIDSQPGGPVRQPYFSYLPAEPHRLTELISRNRFLGSINEYKYGLRSPNKTSCTLVPAFILFWLKFGVTVNIADLTSHC